MRVRLHPDVAEALSRVELGPAILPEWVDWAADALIAGRDLQDVYSDLIQSGWEPAVADAVLESARVRTRRIRGVVTRADVVGDLNARHGRSTTGVAAFYRSGIGLLGIFGFVSGLRSAVAAVQWLRRIAKTGRR